MKKETEASDPLPPPPPPPPAPPADDTPISTELVIKPEEENPEPINNNQVFDPNQSQDNGQNFNPGQFSGQNQIMPQNNFQQQFQGSQFGFQGNQGMQQGGQGNFGGYNNNNNNNQGRGGHNGNYVRPDPSTLPGSATNTGNIYIPPKDEGKMFIGGLNWETTDESLKTYFSQFGDVLECTVMRDNATGRSRGFGFLTFAASKSVTTVLTKEHFLDGKIVSFPMTVYCICANM